MKLAAPFRGYRDSPLRSGPPVWVCAAGKGGIGTSTVTGLLALEAALAGLKVLVVDGDVGLAHTHRLFGLPDGCLGLGALSNRSVTPTDVMRTVPPGVTLVPGGGAATGGQLPSHGQRSALFKRLVSLLDAFDLVLVDGGARLEGVLPALTLPNAGVLAVTAPGQVSLAGTFALLKVLGKQEPPVSVVPVFNQVTEAQAETLYELLDEATQRFLGAPLGAAGALPAESAVPPALTLAPSLLVPPLVGALRALLERLVGRSLGKAA